MNYTLDTNIITAYMKNNTRVKRKLQDAAFDGKEVFINGISYYETKRGYLAINATNKLKIFERFCGTFVVSLLDTQKILDKASEIYADLKQSGQLLPDADILIAAMALTQNLILVSDDSHFSRISSLTVENWLKT